MGVFGAVWFGLFGAACCYLLLSGVVGAGYMGLAGAAEPRLEAVWGCIELSGSAWGHPGLLGNVLVLPGGGQALKMPDAKTIKTIILKYAEMPDTKTTKR